MAFKVKRDQKISQAEVSGSVDSSIYKELIKLSRKTANRTNPMREWVKGILCPQRGDMAEK